MLELRLNQWGDKQGKASADQNWDKHQTNLTIVVAVELPKDDWVSKEEGIQHGVDEHNIHAHEV